MDAPELNRRLRVGAALTLLLLFVWPLLTTRFFTDAYQLAAVWPGTAAFGAAMLLGARERRALVATPARAAAIALWLVYLLSGLVSPSVPRAALGEILRQGLYLGVFLATSDVVWSAARDHRGGEPGSRWPSYAGAGGLALGLWGAVALMALLSLLAAAGLVPCNFILAGRLYTYVGYPNTAGALFAAAFLLGVGVRHTWTRIPAWLGALTGAGQWALLTGVILTLSRGVWVIFPLAVALLLAAWPRGRRPALALELFLLGLPALAVAPLWVGSLGQPTPGAYLFLAGILLAAFAGWLSRRIEGFGPRRQALILAALAVALVGGAAGLYQTGHLPEGLAGRFAGFSLTERSVWERFEWTRDAVAIALDHPVLGVGGGGWDPRYFQYQRYPYYTTEVHNGYAETWAETGTAGLLALLAFFGLSLRGAWRLARARQDAEPETALLAAGLGAGAAALVVHSALDLDLSAGSTCIILWAMCGLVDGVVAEERQRRSSSPSVAGGRRWPRVAATALAVAASLVAASLFGALRVEARAAALYNVGKYAESRDAFALASRLDPLSSRLRAERGTAIQAVADGASDPGLIEEARLQFAAAVRLNPYHPGTMKTYATFLLNYVSPDLAVGGFEQALDLQPFNAVRYEMLAEVNNAVGLQSLRAGDTRKAWRCFTAAVNTGGRMAARAAQVPPQVPPDSRLPPASPALALQVGKALALLGEYDEAARQLEAAHDERPFAPSRETQGVARNRHAEAVIWLSLVEERLGDHEKAAAYLAEARSIVADTDAIRADLGALLGKVDGP